MDLCLCVYVVEEGWGSHDSVTFLCVWLHKRGVLLNHWLNDGHQIQCQCAGTDMLNQFLKA